MDEKNIKSIKTDVFTLTKVEPTGKPLLLIRKGLRMNTRLYIKSILRKVTRKVMLY